MYYYDYDYERDEFYSNDPAIKAERNLYRRASDFIEESYKTLEEIKDWSNEGKACAIHDIKTDGVYFANHEDWQEDDAAYSSCYLDQYNRLLTAIKAIEKTLPRRK